MPTGLSPKMVHRAGRGPLGPLFSLAELTATSGCRKGCSEGLRGSCQGLQGLMMITAHAAVLSSDRLDGVRLDVGSCSRH